VWAALAAIALLWTYWGTLASYLRDQHYQEHFLYLWVFFGLALTRSLRPPFRKRFGLANGRDCFAVLLIAAAWLLLAASEVVGSSMAARTSLVLFLTGIALFTVVAWSVRRCLMHGLLMQLCFGFPYQVYFPLTEKLQWGVAACLALPARLGLAHYEVDSTTVRFADYLLVITPDCAGFGQLLTFVGIAMLGVLSSARNRRRTLGLLGLAIGLAWLSNVARAAVFVALAAAGVRSVVEDPLWHALVGFAVFLPFVVTLVWVILRSHRPLPARAEAVLAAGCVPVAALVLPMLLTHVLLSRGDEAFPAPEYFAALEQPPGYALELRGPSEANDRSVYGTPWLLNARFRAPAGDHFDLLHYATRSHSHLCVHKVAACLHADGQVVCYAPPVLVDGRPWWRIDLDRQDDGDAHVYFAFDVAGERHDDSLATQVEVFRQRLFAGRWEVRFTRVMLDGRLPEAPTPREASLLTWLGRSTTRAP
jgi:exosortase/archaeosortase family protein